jgi:hypothetical protein
VLLIVASAARAQAAYVLFDSGCAGSQKQSCPAINEAGGQLLLGTWNGLTAIELPTGLRAIGGFEVFTKLVGGKPLTVNTAIYDGGESGPSTALAKGTMVISDKADWHRTTFQYPVVVATSRVFLAIELNAAVLRPVVLTGNSTPSFVWDASNSQWNKRGQDRWAVRAIDCRSTPTLTNTRTPVLAKTFDVNLANGRPLMPALLFTGASAEQWSQFRLPLDLRGIGAGGCRLLVSIDIMISTVTDASGNASSTLVVPNDKALTSLLFYQQWVALDPGANQIGLTFSNGGLGLVGER